MYRQNVCILMNNIRDAVPTHTPTPTPWLHFILRQIYPQIKSKYSAKIKKYVGPLIMLSHVGVAACISDADNIQKTGNWIFLATFLPTIALYFSICAAAKNHDSSIQQYFVIKSRRNLVSRVLQRKWMLDLWHRFESNEKIKSYVWYLTFISIRSMRPAIQPIASSPATAEQHTYSFNR